MTDGMSVPENKAARELKTLLEGRPGRLFIQTHNFPDHDAVASAFALQQLLKAWGLAADLIFDGEIQRESLKTAISALGIRIRPWKEVSPEESDSILVVDGCKGARNVTDLPGEEIAVLDHHQVECPESVSFVDIRPSYGACSTLLFEYWKQAGLVPSREVATALMIGLNMDTALMTRDVSRNDVEAYSALYSGADMRMVNSILRNYIQVKDLAFFRKAIDAVVIRDTFAFCWFPDGCNQNLLGILGDFLLSLEEAEFIVLAARNRGRINLSVRSENPRWNAALIVEEVLRGRGFGGGHADMAGGILTEGESFNPEALREEFSRKLPL